MGWGTREKKDTANRIFSNSTEASAKKMGGQGYVRVEGIRTTRGGSLT